MRNFTQILEVEIKDFWIKVKGDFENRGQRTLGSILKDSGPKNLKKGKISNRLNQIDLMIYSKGSWKPQKSQNSKDKIT